MYSHNLATIGPQSGFGRDSHRDSDVHDDDGDAAADE